MYPVNQISLITSFTEAKNIELYQNLAGYREDET
jgi:hypothetical protein